MYVSSINAAIPGYCRVVPSQYKMTMRMFHLMSQQLSRMRHFTAATLARSEEEFNKVRDLSARVTTDGMWLRDTLLTSKQNVHLFILAPFETFRTIFLSRIYSKAQEFLDVINQIVLQTANRNDTIYLNETSNTLGLTLVDSMRLITSSYVDVSEALNVADIKDLDLLRRKLNQLLDMTFLRLHHDRLVPLLVHIDGAATCPWCIEPMNRPLMNSVKSRAMSLVDSIESLLRYTGLYLSSVNDNINWHVGSVQNEGFGNYNHTYDDRLRETLNTLLETMDTFDSEMKSALRLVDHVLQFVWYDTAKARTELLYGSYVGEHVLLRELFQEIHKDIQIFESCWNVTKLAYMNESLEMEEVANSHDFKGEPATPVCYSISCRPRMLKHNHDEHKFQRC